MKKSALRVIKDGNDFAALANIDVEAESPCDVSIVRGEYLMMQTQTAKPYELIQKELAMENEMTNSSDRIMLARVDCEILEAASITEFLQMLEPARHSDEEVPLCLCWLLEAKRLMIEK